MSSQPSKGDGRKASYQGSPERLATVLCPFFGSHKELRYGSGHSPKVEPALIVKQAKLMVALDALSPNWSFKKKDRHTMCDPPKPR